MKKGYKRPNKMAEPDQLERELFLDAYYQGSFWGKSEKTIKDQSKKSLNDSEKELFLRSVEIEGKWRLKQRDTVELMVKEKKVKRKPIVDATIDLHGKTIDDAISLLIRFIDQEKRRGSKTLLVVHGKGTGALKKAIWSLVESDDLIDDFQRAPGSLGGEGAILIRINRLFKR